MANQVNNPTYGFSSKTVATSINGISSSQKPNQPYILDLVTRERLFFQTIPTEHKYHPDSNWAVINSPGRNNPLYHFTGGEDTLSFTMSWYADVSTRDDVLKAVKWLESLGKNNGYDEKPHSLQCIWGDLYRDAKWIMFSSGPIDFSMFDREFGMLPRLAKQEIVLKRITTINRTRTDILSITT